MPSCMWSAPGRLFDRSGLLFAHHWPAGVAYHTNEETASATSTAKSANCPLLGDIPKARPRVGVHRGDRVRRQRR